VSRRKMAIELGFGKWSARTEFKYRGQRRQIELSDFELTEDGNSRFSLSERKDAYDLKVGNTKFEDLFPKMQKRRPKFNNFWPTQSIPLDMSMNLEDRKSVAWQTVRDANRSLFHAKRHLLDCFGNFDSVSPFRDQPQRTYLYSGETAKRIGTTGSNTAIMLAADASRRGALRKNLVGQVSEWFNYTGIARGLSVESLTPRHFELCLVSNDGSKHNICDVGFGCSQVLPVLVSGLSLFSEDDHRRARPRILIVQEPEIHLHPDAQAAMGSFFANLATKSGQIFIETHSDNLVLRIARHVALGDINAEDVAIFYISDDPEERVTEISISETGSFEPDWPNGFFPQRQTESLMLARAAMKKRTSNVQKQMNFQYPDFSE